MTNQNLTKQKERNSSTTNTFTLKCEFFTFTNKVLNKLSKPDRKYTAYITYGMLAANSCLLTDVVDNLQEDTKNLIAWKDLHCI